MNFTAPPLSPSEEREMSHQYSELPFIESRVNSRLTASDTMPMTRSECSAHSGLRNGAEYTYPRAEIQEEEGHSRVLPLYDVRAHI